jgi:alpha-glucosidase (family GH31 glycosyl hydrolase)
MPVVERDLQGWDISGSYKPGSSITSFSLVSSSEAVFPDFTYTLSFPLPSVYRVLLTGPYRPRPPHDNIILKYTPSSFKLVSLDEAKATAVFAFPESKSSGNKSREIHLTWKESITLTVWEKNGSEEPIRLLGDLPSRSYALTENGIIRHWWIERENLHLGLGEKGAPIDLTGRSFSMHGTDAAGYDAYEGDPLYKHTPFLISSPKPESQEKALPSTYAIYHPTNSVGSWDIGRAHDDPWGYFKTFIQDWGGLEEWVIVEDGVKEVVKTFADLVGKPRLVGRDWLGYLGMSTLRFVTYRHS